MIIRQERTRDIGASFSLEDIEEYLTHLADKGRVTGTLEWYRRGLNRLHQYLPDDDKVIHRDTLKAWQLQLVENGYAASTINEFIVVANGYLEFADMREHQVIDRIEHVNEEQPEISRGEYLRLLQTAKFLERERVYLLVKLFGNTDMPVQELSKLTAETVREGKVTVLNKGIKQVVRLPVCLQNELISYADRQGIATGPVFLTRKGEPMSRSNVNAGISQLSEIAKVSVEKATPRALRRMFKTQQENMEQKVRLIVEQAQERMLEQEQMTVGWEEK